MNDNDENVLVELDGSLEELLDALRNKGAEVERFVLDTESQAVTRIAND